MRVVAGRLGGRRLRSVPGEDTRPTTDRARATLFDWIGAGIEGAAVLDLFAGTGAVGIEALSRGAARASFVERSRRALVALERNLAELELTGRSRVVRADALRALGRLRAEGQRFDWIFADPPWSGRGASRLLASADLSPLLSGGASLVLERPATSPAPRSGCGLAFRESRRSGEARFDRYERREAPEE
jgi:16S rRNA (guanine966-N2)-methyltransferase